MWRAFARQKGCWALSGAALLCAAAVVLSGCGVTGRATARPAGHTVQVTERDFQITAPKQLPAGRHRLTITAVDSAGNTSTVRRTFSVCKAVAPKRRAAPRFTG